jgi:hypothetical protein
MPRSERDETAWFFLLVGLVIGAAGLKACEYIDKPATAEAQDAPLADYLVLARAGVKEESLMPRASETTAEHAAAVRDGMLLIDQVYARGAARTHATYERFARQYSPAVFTPMRDRPWIADLRVGSHMPAEWPPNLFWMGAPPRSRQLNGYELWMHGALHDAIAIRKGRVTASCPVPADHWGGPMDHWRGEANGWVPMRCGRSRNEGWLVPAFHTPEELSTARVAWTRATAVGADLARGRARREPARELHLQPGADLPRVPRPSIPTRARDASRAAPHAREAGEVTTTTRG